MKQITIEDKKYNINCNAFTLILHKRLFNRGIMQDVKILQSYLVTQITQTNAIKKKLPKLNDSEVISKVADYMNSYIDDFIEAITRITYTLIYTVDENFISYDEFLKSINKLKIDDDWIVEVTEFAVDCFC